jgi:SSS family solute:Na+ symporter
MTSSVTILSMAAGYVAVLALISVAARKHSRSTAGFTTGGKAFPAVLIGFLMASEFIGTSASLGTAQKAFDSGISAAWNVVALAVGFVLFSFFLARRYKALGENTISGVLRRGYGERVRLATSAIMIVALLIVAIAVYASGGAVFSSLLGLDPTVATLLTGVLSVLYVGIGGMRSVVYTNVLHAVVLLAGIVLAAVVPLREIGGFGALADALPAGRFDPVGVGFGQIMAWMIAGAGATFATQYIVQAISSVRDENTARKASAYAVLVLVPYGVLAAVAGMCAAVLHPDIPSLQALPSLLADMNTLLAGVVISGMIAALFGTVSAITLAVSTLLLKDFYQPMRNPAGEDRRNVRFIRLATVASGIVPMLLALYAKDVLAVTFLGKALRSALAVLVVLFFYAPWFGSRTAALVSILGALVTTVAWFLAGDPLGIDNAYIAVLTPLIVMCVGHLVRRRRAARVEEPVPAAPAR